MVSGDCEGRLFAFECTPTPTASSPGWKPESSATKGQSMSDTPVLGVPHVDFCWEKVAYATRAMLENRPKRYIYTTIDYIIYIRLRERERS